MVGIIGKGHAASSVRGCSGVITGKYGVLKEDLARTTKVLRVEHAKNLEKESVCC